MKEMQADYLIRQNKQDKKKKTVFRIPNQDSMLCEVQSFFIKKAKL